MAVHLLGPSALRLGYLLILVSQLLDAESVFLVHTETPGPQDSESSRSPRDSISSRLAE